MRHPVFLGATAATIALASAASAQYSHGVTMEAVNNYSACNGPSLSNRIANADGFRNGVLGTSGTDFTAGLRWVDSSVWATDFYDPDVSGKSTDDDTHNFDRASDAIAYYSGHGVCSTGDTTQPCTSASSCTSPPLGKSLPAVCRRLPGDASGTCSYTSMTREMAVGNCTSGDASRAGIVNYSSGKVRWGESIFDGGTRWAGAGTNGGVNLVVVDSSCAMMSAREHEVWPAFAGVHLIAFTTVHTGDTADVGDRGSAFAARYTANPFGGVGQAWGDAMNSVSNRNSWCTNAAGTHVYGGGFGFNGCGMNEVVALDSSASMASWRVTTEDWDDIQFDANDALGAAYWAGRWTCNWDCNTYTPTL